MSHDKHEKTQRGGAITNPAIGGIIYKKENGSKNSSGGQPCNRPEYFRRDQHDLQDGAFQSPEY